MSVNVYLNDTHECRRKDDQIDFELIVAQTKGKVTGHSRRWSIQVEFPIVNFIEPIDLIEKFCIQISSLEFTLLSMDWLTCAFDDVIAIDNQLSIQCI